MTSTSLPSLLLKLALALLPALAGPQAWAQGGGQPGAFKFCYKVKVSNWRQLKLVPHAFLEVTRNGQPYFTAGLYPDGIRQEDINAPIERSGCVNMSLEQLKKCSDWLGSYQAETGRQKQQAQACQASAEQAPLVGSLYRALPNSGTVSLCRSAVALRNAFSRDNPPAGHPSGSPYWIFGQNCASFVKEGAKACVGKEINLETYFKAWDPESIRFQGEGR